MADVSRQGVGEVERVAPPPEETTLPSGGIAEEEAAFAELQRQLRGDEEESPADPVEPTPDTPATPTTPAESADGGELSTLSSRVAELAEGLAASKAEGDALRHVIRQLMQQQSGATRETKAPDLLDGFDLAAFQQELQTAPAQAIAKFGKMIADRTEERVSRQLSEKTEARVSAGERMGRLQDADRTKTRAEFGDYLENPIFTDRANAIYNDLTADSSGEWKPAAYYTAAAMAHSQLIREGKLKSVREVSKSPAARPTKPTRQAFGEESPATGGGVDKDFSSMDRGAVRKVCRELGISEETFMKNYSSEKKKNPFYGVG